MSDRLGGFFSRPPACIRSTLTFHSPLHPPAPRNKTHKWPPPLTQSYQHASLQPLTVCINMHARAARSGRSSATSHAQSTPTPADARARLSLQLIVDRGEIRYLTLGPSYYIQRYSFCAGTSLHGGLDPLLAAPEWQKSLLRMPAMDDS